MKLSHKENTHDDKNIVEMLKDTNFIFRIGYLNNSVSEKQKPEVILRGRVQQRRGRGGSQPVQLRPEQKNTRIGTDQMETEEGGTRDISIIAISTVKEQTSPLTIFSTRSTPLSPLIPPRR
jgi:hypothetical protein